MKSTTLVLLLQIAGILHLGLLCAGVMMPRVTGLRAHLAGLPPFVRQLFWVYYTFIGFSIISFGVLTFFLAQELATGSVLARAVCVFLAGFWSLRFIAAVFVFDVSPYLRNGFWRLSYHAVNLVFVYLPVVYALAAWKGGGL